MKRVDDPSEGQVWVNLYRDEDGVVWPDGDVWDCSVCAEENAHPGSIGLAHGTLKFHYYGTEDSTLD